VISGRDSGDRSWLPDVGAVGRRGAGREVDGSKAACQFVSAVRGGPARGTPDVAPDDSVIGIGIGVGVGIGIGIGIGVGIGVGVSIGVGIGVGVDVGISVDVGIVVG